MCCADENVSLLTTAAVSQNVSRDIQCACYKTKVSERIDGLGRCVTVVQGIALTALGMMEAEEVLSSAQHLRIPPPAKAALPPIDVKDFTSVRSSLGSVRTPSLLEIANTPTTAYYEDMTHSVDHAQPGSDWVDPWMRDQQRLDAAASAPIKSRRYVEASARYYEEEERLQQLTRQTLLSHGTTGLVEEPEEVKLYGQRSSLPPRTLPEPSPQREEAEATAPAPSRETEMDFDGLNTLSNAKYVQLMDRFHRLMDSIDMPTTTAPSETVAETSPPPAPAVKSPLTATILAGRSTASDEDIREEVRRMTQRYVFGESAEVPPPPTVPRRIALDHSPERHERYASGAGSSPRPSAPAAAESLATEWDRDSLEYLPPRGQRDREAPPPPPPVPPVTVSGTEPLPQPVSISAKKPQPPLPSERAFWQELQLVKDVTAASEAVHDTVGSEEQVPVAGTERLGATSISQEALMLTVTRLEATKKELQQKLEDAQVRDE